MSITIGRYSGIDPKGFTWSGNQLTLQLDVFPTNANDTNEMKARRQQLLGLADNLDEPVIPLTWSLDSQLDGFYQVVSVNVPQGRMVENIDGRLTDVTVVLNRVTGYVAPWFETTMLAPLRTNAFAITAPANAITAVYGNGLATIADVPATLIGGSVAAFTTADSSTENLAINYRAGPISTLAAFRVTDTPANYYVGSARVEVLYNATWYPMIGYQIPPGAVWRLNNGMIRLTSAQGATAATLEMYVPSVWISSTSICHYSAGVAVPLGGTGPYVSILRNTPGEVVIRVPVYYVAASVVAYANYTIRRGIPFIEVQWFSVNGTQQLGAGFSAVTVAASTTSGIQTNANDASGNRVTFGMAVAKTNDLVNGRVIPTAAATSGSMYIGAVIGGSGAAAPFRVADIADQYFAPICSSQRIVTR